MTISPAMGNDALRTLARQAIAAERGSGASAQSPANPNVPADHDASRGAQTIGDPVVRDVSDRVLDSMGHGDGANATGQTQDMSGEIQADVDHGGFSPEWEAAFVELFSAYGMDAQEQAAILDEMAAEGFSDDDLVMIYEMAAEEFAGGMVTGAGPTEDTQAADQATPETAEPGWSGEWHDAFAELGVEEDALAYLAESGATESELVEMYQAVVAEIAAVEQGHAVDSEQPVEGGWNEEWHGAFGELLGHVIDADEADEILAEFAQLGLSDAELRAEYEELHAAVEQQLAMGAQPDMSEVAGPLLAGAALVAGAGVASRVVTQAIVNHANRSPEALARIQNSSLASRTGPVLGRAAQILGIDGRAADRTRFLMQEVLTRKGMSATGAAESASRIASGQSTRALHRLAERHGIAIENKTVHQLAREVAGKEGVRYTTKAAQAGAQAATGAGRTITTAAGQTLNLARYDQLTAAKKATSIFKPGARFRAALSAAQVSPSVQAATAVGTNGARARLAAGMSAELAAIGGGKGMLRAGANAVKGKAGIASVALIAALEAPKIIESYRNEGGFGRETSQATGSAVGKGAGFVGGWAVGAKGGAAAGAAIGTFIAPGIGTAIGGGIGAIAGGLAGSAAGGWVMDKVGGAVGGAAHSAVSGVKSLFGGG